MSCAFAFSDLWYLPCSEPGEWCQSCKSQLVTRDMKREIALPTSGSARPTQHTNSPRAENHQLLHLYMCRNKEFTSLVVSDALEGREESCIQTKQWTLCLPFSWYFNPNIQRMLLPTLEFNFFFSVSPVFCSLDKCLYGAQLHKVYCQVGHWKPWTKVRDCRWACFLMRLSPIPTVGG